MNAQVQSFLNFLAVEKGFSQNTIDAYGNDLRQFTAFLETIISVPVLIPAMIPTVEPARSLNRNPRQ